MTTQLISKVPKIIQSLQQRNAGEVSLMNDTYIFRFSSGFGKGQLRCTKLQDGLMAIDLSGTVYHDTIFDLNLDMSTTLQFIYCLEGYSYHRFDNKQEYTTIEPFQMAVIGCKERLPSLLKCVANESFAISIILTDKDKYFGTLSNEHNAYGKKLKKQLRRLDSNFKFFHLGNYNLRIAQELRPIFEGEHENDFSRQLSKKGRYYIILAKQIEQFLTEVGSPKNSSGLLRQELKKITEVSEYIQEYPEIQHTIKSLCRRAGISPAKLQVGFKFMFDRTVSDYIRNVRLEKAEKLIRTTDLSISEVVYSIGLTSRSYFCKIFKAKYNCRPKEYKQRNTVLI
ncbi:MAG: AraC family transcriptional regulator [Cytophagaceae bacterium]|nr:AraC family transcriptional regulator [Cytophagaceae bacterium]|tara:strand:- start:62 stop:1081 length:1020 start_codon:yes stop_codon:yes gene_type:complete